jgi:hypothetical protein
MTGGAPGSPREYSTGGILDGNLPPGPWPHEPNLMHIEAIMPLGGAHPIYLDLMSPACRGVPAASEKSWVIQVTSPCRLKPAVAWARCARLTLNAISLPDTTVSIYSHCCTKQNLNYLIKCRRMVTAAAAAPAEAGRHWPPKPPAHRRRRNPGSRVYTRCQKFFPALPHPSPLPPLGGEGTRGKNFWQTL